MEKYKTKKFLKEQSETILLGYDEKNCPVIAVWKISDYSVGFYCRYCKKVHTHGIGNGHRTSHCINPDSLYKKKGYVLIQQDNIGDFK